MMNNYIMSLLGYIIVATGVSFTLVGILNKDWGFIGFGLVLSGIGFGLFLQFSEL